MLNRRDFLKVATATGTLGLTNRINALTSRHQDSGGYFAVHEFIRNNPDAVFIMRTNVDVKTNAAEKVSAGMDVARSVFVPATEGDNAIPLTHTIALKPNLTWAQKTNAQATEEGCRGIVTDPEFVEGIVEGMKELGLSGSQFHIRDLWASNQLDFTGYADMAERTGVSASGYVSGNEVWVDLTDSVWFKRTGYIYPINAPDTALINIAKFKAHTMGITGCAKNLQGSMIEDYVGHCTPFGRDMGINTDHIVPGAFDTVQEYFDRHLADGIPRWDSVGTGTGNDGRCMELWCHRCIDNHTVTKPALHMIEGIYGRDGYFVNGPAENGLATDYMTNIVFFGMNPFHIDTIAHWVAGHEPGNIGLFHVAIERGLSSILNPMDIPVYEWTPDGTATLTPLTDFERTPLKTIYLRQEGEDQYHMVDEPYDYPSNPTAVGGKSQPKAFVLGQNYPNPFNPQTSIEYSLPTGGSARLEIYNSSGQLVDVLVNGYTPAGSHMAVWNTRNYASGTYFYRFRSGDFTQTRKMVLMK